MTKIDQITTVKTKLYDVMGGVAVIASLVAIWYGMCALDAVCYAMNTI